MTKCPICGYNENLSTKKVTNAMNTYVDDKTGKVDGVYNSEENYIEIKGKKLRKQSYTPPSPPAAPTANAPANVPKTGETK